MRNGYLRAAGSLVLLGLVAFTVYRSYRINHASLDGVLVSDLPVAVQSSAFQPITTADLRRSCPVCSSFKTYYAYGEPLPAGYRCSAAGGMVYRTLQEHGTMKIDPLVVGGVAVRCGGDWRSSNRSSRSKTG
jgi:hypothetical protein